MFMLDRFNLSKMKLINNNNSNNFKMIKKLTKLNFF